MKKLFSICVIIAVVFSFINVSAQEKIIVGVAANYIQVFNEISHTFEVESDIKVVATFTSSGNLYSQIINGAPYDLFLSADEERPARLYKVGLAEKPFIYARGQVILWSAHKDFCKSRGWREAVKDLEIKKVSIANPEIAPYGLGAKKALLKTGLWDLLKSKIVYSQDIVQAFHYASTEAVDATFCSLAVVYTKQGKTGCYYAIKEAPSIVQTACLLKKTKNRKAIDKFIAFLNSAEAGKIKRRYGYQ